jgi:Low molecular weight phosphotyrosine protein phosphatase
VSEFLDINSDVVARREFTVASLLVVALTLANCSSVLAKQHKPKILFVCQAGTAKSAIARELFRKRARERGIAVDVFSRGIVLEDHISPELRSKLVADRIDSAAEPAQVLGAADLKAADMLVRFNPLPAGVVHPDIRDWSDLPSVNDDYSNARKILDERLDMLLDEIVGATPKP